MATAASTLAGVSAGRFRRRNYGRNHGYLLDGQKIISVTKALSLGMPKPALINWAASQAAQMAWDKKDELAAAPYSEFIATVAKAHEKVRNTAAVKGTAVHNFGQRLVHGERVDGIPDEVAKKVDHYVRFLNEWQVEPLAVERPVCNLAEPYGGTFDLVFRTPLFPERVFLGDIKTAKGVYGDNALQLEGYARADFYIDEHESEVEMSTLGITDHVVIHLEDAGYHVVEMERGDAVFAAFQNAIATARLFDGPRGETELDALVVGEIFKPGEAWL
ncbi:hypothetical protein QE428_002633 [Microbacterium sp. SORGH_AS 505]|uniref:hypothetical protein n=1 Tax=Microbacterium sp. SORGH_AS_0505 TaxID=3041770 RepID=UPI002785F0B4|nr:hypothetical protein [Microbacterium sp. SORGH_AS_0505]MDQ1127600.1 hypothetical protein [Microbacterium sp. SORGH_AS_0505]